MAYICTVDRLNLTVQCATACVSTYKAGALYKADFQIVWSKYGCNMT